MTPKEKERMDLALKEGINVELFWNENKQLIQHVNGVETILPVGLGHQIERWNKNPVDWSYGGKYFRLKEIIITG